MSATNPEALVIGYGSVIRGDDAIGHHVAAALREQLPLNKNTRLLTAHQLDVTMAQDVASSDLVIFVDATVSASQDREVMVQPVVAAQDGRTGVVSHALTPAGLLGVAKWLHGRAPEAFLVAIAVGDVSLGEGLSEAARDAVPEAVRTVMGLLNDRG